MKPLRFAAILAACLCTPAILAQDGGRIVRLNDGIGLGHCVNGSKEKVWLTVRRIVTQRHGGFLTTDRAVSLFANVQVLTDPPQSRSLSFPLTKKAGIAKYEVGQISVPVEFPLATGFALMEESKANQKERPLAYTGFSVEVSLLNERGRSAWGKAMLALSDLASGLPIPASPAKTAGLYVLDVANKAVKDELEAQAADMKLLTSALQFNFSPDGGGCPASDRDPGDFERTGTKAILFASGRASSESYVPLSDIDHFCFSVSLVPTVEVKVAKKSPSGACGATYAEIANDYVAFYLNSKPTGASLGSDPLTEESLLRCRANGIKPQECFAER